MATKMVTIHLTEMDWVDANWLHQRWDRDAWLGRGLGIALLACTGFLLLDNDSLSPPLNALGGGLLSLPVVFWVLNPVLLRLMLPGRVRKLFLQTKAALAPFNMEWDERGVSFTSENWSQKNVWSDFLKWRENEKVFLLYINNQSFRIIPLRFFADPSQFENFATTARKNVQKG